MKSTYVIAVVRLLYDGQHVSCKVMVTVPSRVAPNLPGPRAGSGADGAGRYRVQADRQIPGSAQVSGSGGRWVLLYRLGRKKVNY
jgi:hypothetical protein